MPEISEKKDKDGMYHLDSKFMKESLVDKELAKSAITETEVDIIPYLNVISLGAKSIIDKGRSAVYPSGEEVAAAK